MPLGSRYVAGTIFARLRPSARSQKASAQHFIGALNFEGAQARLQKVEEFVTAGIASAIRGLWIGCRSVVDFPHAQNDFAQLLVSPGRRRPHLGSELLFDLVGHQASPLQGFAQYQGFLSYWPVHPQHTIVRRVENIDFGPGVRRSPPASRQVASRADSSGLTAHSLW